MEESSESKASSNENSEEKAKSKQEHSDLYETIKEYGTRAILLFAPVHYLLHPEDLAVLIVDYLKIHPSVVSSIIQYTAPAAAGWLSVWALIISVVLFLLVLFLTIGIVLFILSLINEISSRVLLSKYFRGFEFLTLKAVCNYFNSFPDIDKYRDKIDSINSGLTSFTIAILYLFTVMGKTHWSSSSNPKILISAQKHYFCQVTSGYNQEECNKVKDK